MSNKSEAAWHPNNGPMTDHADLIARLRAIFDVTEDEYTDIDQAANVIQNLADSVPRAQYDLTVLELTRQISNTRDERDEARAEHDALQRGVVAATERAEAAEAERDALAHVIEQVEGWFRSTPDSTSYETLRAILAAAPTVHLDRHDAEVKAQALEDALEILEDVDPDDMRVWLRERAAAIRQE